MPSIKMKRGEFSSLLVALAFAGVAGAPGGVRGQATQPAVDLPGLNADSFYGKDSPEGVYVRDSAGAVEKLALAQKMERLREWNKSADLYQEVIAKYADRVVPSKLDEDKTICQYTSITSPVQERLAHWPQQGLDAYRARFEAPAAALLDAARKEDVAALNRVYSLYFVTESGKQAGIRLIDLYLESGEYPAAGWVGDRLLALHPSLDAERPAVIYRTGLAAYFAGDRDKAKSLLSQLKTKFANDRGIVRGKDVILADSLAAEIEAPVSTSDYASADSWPMAWGDPTRSRISTADGRPGARLYGIPLSTPNWGSIKGPELVTLGQAYEGSIHDGLTTGIMPVADRGELFFQDGQKLWAISLESGAPLPGWVQTYPKGEYVLPGVVGTPRGHQLTVSLTEHDVLAIMGQPDHLSPVQNQQQPSIESRIVCLDRQSGRERWTIALSQLPDEAKDSRALELVGSPLVVGDSVLVIGKGAKTQFEDCYVLAFDLATGKHRWSTYISSASAGQPMAMDGTTSPTGETASHLAYANGRVYVQTNLGALAALDAYTGGLVWLDIYPTGRSPNMAQMRFQRFNDSGLMSVARRPWTFNPVIVSDGNVFSLPSEGRNLLIYDAATGAEIKRIDVKDIEQKIEVLAHLDTLVGVIGDKLLMAGDKGMICLNWKTYARDAFDPRTDNITVWYTEFPKDGESSPGLRGRPFLTHDAVFVPNQDRLYCLSLKSGKLLVSYPSTGAGSQGHWQDPEEPGNVLVTSDHVIIAGAKSVNVYTDLALAKARLEREMAASPADPQLRLHYAEILYAAGEWDASTANLDSAARLLGGLNTLRPGNARGRLFSDALAFADKMSKNGPDADRERVLKFYDRASASAESPVDQVNYRLSRGKFAEAIHDDVAALQFYEEILSDPQLRAVPLADEATATLTRADAMAESAIDAIIKARPDAYAPFEQAAAAALESLKTAEVDPAGKLLELSRKYPNSAVSARAMFAAAAVYEATGYSRYAIRVLRDMWYKQHDNGERVTIQESIARNDLALSAAPRKSAGDLGPVDNLEAAAAALSRAISINPDARLQKPLKLRDGSTLAAGAALGDALAAVRKDRAAGDGRSLPDFHIPIPVKGSGKNRRAFLAVDPERDVLPNIKALVLPIHDFSRPDRMVAFTTGGVLEIFSPGESKPLASGQVLTDEPKGCAWTGERLLVWSGQQLASLNPTGAAAWKLDLRDMLPLEVVRIGDKSEQVTSRALDVNAQNIIVQGQRVQIIIGANGQRRVIRRRGFPQPQPPIPVVAAAARPAGPEEIVDVRPVGDRVLVTTSTGRLLAVELATGRVSWQTRLSEHPIDRLVANEDFTAIQQSDDRSVRIAVFDTATGQIRCTKNFDQAGAAPVNLALAADGQLVYTLSDRICLKDLYKPWGDENPAGDKSDILSFAPFTQPGQLLISEGRILALADDGKQAGMGGDPKQTIAVRIFSLETGKSLELQYMSPSGQKSVDRRLLAGESENATMRIVGPHLYVVSPGHVFSYNLDKPEETWGIIKDEQPLLNVREVVPSQKWLAVLDADVPEAAPPAAGAAPAAPAGEPANDTAESYHIYLFRLAARSATNAGESGVLDYDPAVTDAAGISSKWQAVNGGFYYLTGDNKLHFLRGSEKPAQ